MLASSVGAPAGEAGKKLLAEIMERPGGWRQMCSFLEPTPFDAPVPVYSGSLLTRYFELGDKEAALGQKQRSEVLPALMEALTGMDLARPPGVTRGWSDPGEGGGTRAGFKPDWLNPLHLRIIRELNAVEALPELLRLEGQLHGLLETGEKDAKALLPDLPLDASIFPVRPGAAYHDKEIGPAILDSAAFKRDRRVLTCRIFQREILGTITVLLRIEDFPPATKKFEPLQREAKARLADAITKAKQKLAAAEVKLAETKQEAAREEMNGCHHELEEAAPSSTGTWIIPGMALKLPTPPKSAPKSRRWPRLS